MGPGLVGGKTWKLGSYSSWRGGGGLLTEGRSTVRGHVGRD